MKENGRVVEEQQPQVVIESLLEVGMSHGDTAECDLNNIQIEGGVPYFCSSFFDDIAPVEQGDGRELPDEVLFDVSHVGIPDGWYDIRNVMIHTNGTVRIEITQDTIFNPVLY